MEDDELSEKAKKYVAFKRQLKCCGGVLITSLVSGMSWVLNFYDSSYIDSINKTVLYYSRGTVAAAAFLTASCCAHFFGRKKTVIGMQLLYVSPLLVTAATMDPIVLYVCGLTKKFANDMLLVVLSLYTSEVSQARSRGFFIGSYYLAFYVGVTVGRLLPDTAQMVVFLSIVLDTAALGFSVTAPETPHYLAMTDRADEAEEVLQRLWIDADEEANALLEKAESYTEEYRKGIFPIMMSTRFMVPLVLCFSYTLANYHICHLFYKPTKEAAEAYNYPYMKMLRTHVIKGIKLQKILLDLANILGCFFYLILSFLFRRRPLVFLSLISSLAFGFTFVLAPLGPKVLAIVYFCPMCERLGLRQTAQILPTEIFPAVTRDIGVTLSYMIHYVFINHSEHFMLIKKPYGMIEIIKISLLVLFPLGMILIYLFMPETKDLPLTETEELGGNFVVQPLLDSDSANEEIVSNEE